MPLPAMICHHSPIDMRMPRGSWLRAGRVSVAAPPEIYYRRGTFSEMGSPMVSSYQRAISSQSIGMNG